MHVFFVSRQRMSQFPPAQLFHTLSRNDVNTLIDVITILRPYFDLPPFPACSGRPAQLSVEIHDFLKAILGVRDEEMKMIWESFGDYVWAEVTNNPKPSLEKYIQLFIDHGTSRGIGEVNLDSLNKFLPCFSNLCSSTAKGASEAD